MGGESDEILTRLGIPRAHWDATLDRVPDGCGHKPTIADYLEHLIENVRRPRGLLLFGPYSAGKSAIAAVVLKRAAALGVVGFWVPYKRLPEWHKAEARFDDTQTVWERAVSAPLLVLDEVQVRWEKTYPEFLLEDLVRLRVDARACMVLTTNLAPAEIAERHEALHAVLQEAVVPLKVAGHDFRRGWFG